MKAVILNSGIGRRMHPFTVKNPKCLAQINGQTILGHEIKNLLHYGIKDIIITIGHLGKNIKKFMRENFPDVNITYVENPRYESTNAIYSMWLLKDLVADEVIYMHGDMVFEKELLGKLLNHKIGSCVLVNNKIEPPEKDFKGRVVNNLVKRIAVDVSGENTFFLSPIYKLTKEDFKIWMEEIEKFVKEGKVNVYAEDAFNAISNKIKLYPVYFGDELCMEVDDFNDLKIARKFFNKQKMSKPILLGNEN